jgi:hypothetical protein
MDEETRPLTEEEKRELGDKYGPETKDALMPFIALLSKYLALDDRVGVLFALQSCQMLIANTGVQAGFLKPEQAGERVH